MKNFYVSSLVNKSALMLESAVLSPTRTRLCVTIKSQVWNGADFYAVVAKSHIYCIQRATGAYRDVISELNGLGETVCRIHLMDSMLVADDFFFWLWMSTAVRQGSGRNPFHPSCSCLVRLFFHTSIYIKKRTLTWRESYLPKWKDSHADVSLLPERLWSLGSNAWTALTAVAQRMYNIVQNDLSEGGFLLSCMYDRHIFEGQPCCTCNQCANIKSTV